MENLRVAVCEMTSIDDWGFNQKTILEKLQKLQERELDFISFPENSLYLRVNEEKPFPSVPIEHEIFEPIQDYAKRLKALIHLGSVPIQDGGAQYNGTVLLYPDGSRQLIYKKMHLFDVEISGHRSYRESDLYSKGSSPSVFQWREWKFGASICYDLRFSELYQYYAREAVDVILIPAAFTVPTGSAHWEILLRARAIESQCYVLAAAQQGKHGVRRETYGHSMIIDPWGKILAEAKPNDNLNSTLNKAEIAKVRAQIPMANHRHELHKILKA